MSIFHELGLKIIFHSQPVGKDQSEINNSLGSFVAGSTEFTQNSLLIVPTLNENYAENSNIIFTLQRTTECNLYQLQAVRLNIKLTFVVRT